MPLHQDFEQDENYYVPSDRYRDRLGGRRAEQCSHAPADADEYDYAAQAYHPATSAPPRARQAGEAREAYDGRSPPPRLQRPRLTRPSADVHEMDAGYDDLQPRSARRTYEVYEECGEHEEYEEHEEYMPEASFNNLRPGLQTTHPARLARPDRLAADEYEDEMDDRYASQHPRARRTYGKYEEYVDPASVHNPRPPARSQPARHIQDISGSAGYGFARSRRPTVEYDDEVDDVHSLPPARMTGPPARAVWPPPCRAVSPLPRRPVSPPPHRPVSPPFRRGVSRPPYRVFSRLPSDCEMRYEYELRTPAYSSPTVEDEIEHEPVPSTIRREAEGQRRKAKVSRFPEPTSEPAWEEGKTFLDLTSAEQVRVAETSDCRDATVKDFPVKIAAFRTSWAY